MLSKKELLKQLIGKKVHFDTTLAGGYIDKFDQRLPNNYAYILDVGDDMVEIESQYESFYEYKANEIVKRRFFFMIDKITNIET